MIDSGQPAETAQPEVALQRALTLHQQGRLAQAKLIYEAVLEIAPRHCEANHLLAVIAVQSGSPDRALELSNKAIEIDPLRAAPYCTKGAAHQALKQFEAALASYDRALALKPDFAAAFCNRGNTLRSLYRLDEALASYDRAIALNPNIAEAHSNRGIVLSELKRCDAALASYDRAIAINPQLVQAHSNRGDALRELGRLDEALASCNHAIEIAAECAEAWCNRGLILRELNELDAALASCNRAIEIDAKSPIAWCNRGIVLKELAQFDAALASYDNSIVLKADYAEAHRNRGLVLEAMHQVDAAVASCNRAITLNSDLAAAYFNRATASLLGGRFETGWADYEWRWRSANLPWREADGNLDQPLWRGEESLAGKTVLLHAEQCLGDMIQFCRYASLVAELGAHVTLEVPETLRPLLESLSGVSRVIARGETLPATDYHCPLLSLPFAFKTTLASVPSSVPYLKAAAPKLLSWSIRLGEKKKPRVGLVWSGGARPKMTDRRKIALEKFASLRQFDIEFFSLQKGQPAESELAELISNRWSGPDLIDVTHELHDFSDTAALIEHLDLVISVDTSTAHLAGALGKPVWILLRFDSCWRWLLERADSPWYPTARLYRQASPGDWDAVIERVNRDLAEWLDSSQPCGR
jgi:tetratricopeptide (TPR) repeat protein